MGENENVGTPLDLREQLAAAFAADNADAGAGGDPAEGMSSAAAEGEQALPADGTPVSEAGVEAADSAPAPEQNAPVQGSAPEASVGGMDQAALAMQMADRATQALRQMQEENARLRAVVEQQNQLARDTAQAVVEDRTPKQPQMPVFDTSGWAYMDDTARQKASADFTAAMAEYMRSQMEGEIAPIKASFEEQREAAAKAAAIGALGNNEKMAGFSDALPQIERILSRTPSLAAEKNPELRYALGYLLKRGYDAVNAVPAQRSAADVAKDAMANPEVMRIIEAERARAVAERNANAVPQSASTGTSNAPAAPQIKPQNLGEARDLLRRSFGL